MHVTSCSVDLMSQRRLVLHRPRPYLEASPGLALVRGNLADACSYLCLTLWFFGSFKVFCVSLISVLTDIQI
jgi:hypothetical protein